MKKIMAIMVVVIVLVTLQALSQRRPDACGQILLSLEQNQPLTQESMNRALGLIHANRCPVPHDLVAYDQVWGR
jgi:hypothetical protein